jgi:cobalt-zinc-cadmium efflux system protein
MRGLAGPSPTHASRASYGEPVPTGHAAHLHGAAETDRGRLSIALALIVSFMALEIAAGIVAHSLALLSDAAHMLTDAAAVAFSLFALGLAARPARGAMTFGFRRVEILSAQANGVTLLVFAGFITYEAIRRLFDPPAVRGGLMLAVALVGVLVNLGAIRALAGADRGSLNVEGSFQHILMDLYGFIGTALAAAVILFTGFVRADPLVSLLIALLMIRSGLELVKASGRIFLEAAPVGLDPRTIGRALVGEPGVAEVHDLHVWEVTSGFPALSAHVLVDPDSNCHAARRRMEAMLHDRFGVDHTTLQVDHTGGELLEIEPVPGAESGETAAR